jgi:hypothetical protein
MFRMSYVLITPKKVVRFPLGSHRTLRSLVRPLLHLHTPSTDNLAGMGLANTALLKCNPAAAAPAAALGV